VVVASGLTLQLEHMSWLHSDGYRLADYKFAHLERPCRYVYERLEPGDVILSTAPHVVEHHLQRWAREKSTIDVSESTSLDANGAMSRPNRGGVKSFPTPSPRGIGQGEAATVQRQSASAPPYNSTAPRDFWSLDFWPESRLHLQAILDDHRPVPLHR